MKNLDEFKLKTDKLKIFSDREILNEYIENEQDIIQMSDFLSDEEKLEIIKFEHIKNNSKLVCSIISKIKKEEIRIKIAMDLEFMEGLGLSEGEKADVIKKIQDSKVKEQLLLKYRFNKVYQVAIAQTLDSSEKIEFLLSNSVKLEKYDILSIISSLSVNDQIGFIKKNNEYMKDKGISVFNIVRKNANKFFSAKQLEFIKRLDELNLTEEEKKLIYAGLDNGVKDKIDISKIEEKYVKYVKMRLFEAALTDYKSVNKDGKIIPDLNENLMLYQGLDEILYINPILYQQSDEDRKKIIELCKICPNLKVYDEYELSGISSTTEEFLKAEQWIQSVLESLSPDWTDVQKMAYIDTAIGKVASYTPEQGTEAENYTDERALWKIIVDGNGVCNGIAQIEKYMFKRIGIESELVSTGTHAYLLVKNIEIPNQSGTVIGDTLVDPTWNLYSSRFDARPWHFCKSYEELRKLDIDINGLDHNSHKSSKLEEMSLIEMDEVTLRNIYKSIGIARKDGVFPIVSEIEQVEKIDKSGVSFEEKIEKKFEVLKRKCPDFIRCMNSTISFMQWILFIDNENFHYDRCIASRVFDKQDSDKKAVLFNYFEVDGKKIFYYADSERGEMVRLSQKEFEEKFSCYDTDKEKRNGKNLWDSNEDKQKKEEQDLV